jgi:ATP-dependent RNA helicase DDX54/DBP10
VHKGVVRKGYRQPTPIQRRAIPLVCSGRDVVAMSRTGSGKTAAFVVPMLQRLKKRDTRGIRALLLSPTRELALQTFKIVKEVGDDVKELMWKYFFSLVASRASFVPASLVATTWTSSSPSFTNIRTCEWAKCEWICVKILNFFSLLATPGRLLHIVCEMNLKLSSIQYLVFDEADRLFEMGFADQLKVF